MDDQKKIESERAQRIIFMTEGFQVSITSINERLIDREYDTIREDIRLLIHDLREVVKIMEDDDF
jgi:hypothetical protein